MFRLFPQLNEQALSSILPKETIILLGSILRWICSDSKPEFLIEDEKMFFFLSKEYFSSSPFFSKPTILKGFKILSEKNFISQVNIKRGKKYFYAFNWNLILQYVDNKNWNESIMKIKENEMEGLFEIDKPAKVQKYPEQASKIAEEVLDSFGFFVTKKNPNTKTFQTAVKFIADLHAGLITNSRLYPIRDEREEFSISGWKEKITAVKLDWAKVRKIIFDSLENYGFMFKEDYVPYNKKYLPNALDKYFYNPISKESYFIRSLNKPVQTKKFLSEKKADNIFSSLPPTVQQAGEELLDLNPSMSSGIYWEKIKDLFDWSTALKEHEAMSGYWFENPSDLLYKYHDFLESNKINVAINTLDISKIDSGSTPWKRFLQNAINKHELNPELLTCGNAKDICDLYENKELVF